MVGMMSMKVHRLLGWILNLASIGIVVYYATKLALKNNHKN